MEHYTLPVNYIRVAGTELEVWLAAVTHVALYLSECPYEDGGSLEVRVAGLALTIRDASGIAEELVYDLDQGIWVYPTSDGSRPE